MAVNKYVESWDVKRPTIRLVRYVASPVLLTFILTILQLPPVHLQPVEVRLQGAPNNIQSFKQIFQCQPGIGNRPLYTLYGLKPV